MSIPVKRYQMFPALFCPHGLDLSAENIQKTVYEIQKQLNAMPLNHDFLEFFMGKSGITGNEKNEWRARALHGDIEVIGSYNLNLAFYRHILRFTFFEEEFSRILYRDDALQHNEWMKLLADIAMAFGNRQLLVAPFHDEDYHDLFDLEEGTWDAMTHNLHTVLGEPIKDLQIIREGNDYGYCYISFD